MSKLKNPLQGIFLGGATLLLLVLFFSAFKNPNNKNVGNVNCVSSISYGEVEKTYYRVSPREQKKLNDFDKTKMQEKTVSTNVSKCVNSKGGLSTIVSFKNTREIWESWQPQIGKLEITKNAIKQFDIRGKLMKEVKTTERDRTAYSKMEEHQSQNPGFGLPKEAWDFKLTPDVRNKLQKEGYEVRELKNGVIRVSNEDISTLYDPENMTVSNTYFSKGKKESATLIQYIEVNGSYYPKFKTKVSTVISPSSGACMELIHQSEFTDYKIN